MSRVHIKIIHVRFAPPRAALTRASLALRLYTNLALHRYRGRMHGSACDEEVVLAQPTGVPYFIVEWSRPFLREDICAPKTFRMVSISNE